MISKGSIITIASLVLLGLFIVYGGIFYFQHLRPGQQVPTQTQSPTQEEPMTTEDIVGAATTTPTIIGRCVVSGCSGEICSDESVISNCMYRSEFACYRTAQCERQGDGACGWTQTPELLVCLNSERDASMAVPSMTEF